MGKKVYRDPQTTAELVKKNYGFAGREFVSVLKKIGFEEVERIQREIQRKIHNDEKMQKQSISLSIVLTADRIVTDHLFKDGQYISLDDAAQVLVDRNELSDNERCYQYILSEVDINRAKFDAMSQTNEKWGMIEHGYAVIYNNIFDSICKKGGFSRKAFLSWADRNGLIQTQGGQLTKVKKAEGKTIRCVFIKMDASIDENGFQSVEDADIQEELPFK